jgi:RNA recognition motif-containing protein
VGSSSSQPGVGVNNAPCSTLFVANLGQFVSEHELKEIFSRCGSHHVILINPSEAPNMIVQISLTLKMTWEGGLSAVARFISE